MFIHVLGNPGVANFYEEFMSIVHEKSGARVPIWCISHAGHVSLPPELSHKSKCSVLSEF